MVCLGNICRSPLAEGILQDKINKYNIVANVDSCGFESYHEGDSPDYRAQEIALAKGINISHLKSRLFKISDFDNFDKIFVMDSINYADVANVARDENDMRKVDFIRNEVEEGKNKAVADPYYGGKEGFIKVFEQLNEACETLATKAYDNIKRNIIFNTIINLTI